MPNGTSLPKYPVMDFSLANLLDSHGSGSVNNLIFTLKGRQILPNKDSRQRITMILISKRISLWLVCTYFRNTHTSLDEVGFLNSRNMSFLSWSKLYPWGLYFNNKNRVYGGWNINLSVIYTKVSRMPGGPVLVCIEFEQGDLLHFR